MTPNRFISFSNSKRTLEKRTWSQPPLEINSYKAQEAFSYFGGNFTCVHMVSRNVFAKVNHIAKKCSLFNSITELNGSTQIAR